MNKMTQASEAFLSFTPFLYGMSLVNGLKARRFRTIQRWSWWCLEQLVLAPGEVSTKIAARGGPDSTRSPGYLLLYFTEHIQKHPKSIIDNWGWNGYLYFWTNDKPIIEQNRGESSPNMRDVPYINHQYLRYNTFFSGCQLRVCYRFCEPKYYVNNIWKPIYKYKWFQVGFRCCLLHFPSLLFRSMTVRRGFCKSALRNCAGTKLHDFLPATRCWLHLLVRG